MKRNYMKLTVPLSLGEFDFLQKVSDESEISKSEFIRLIVQGMMLGESISNGESQKVDVGGYGFSFQTEEMKMLVQDINDRLDRFLKDVNVEQIKGNKSFRVKRIKAREKVL
jgi:hypothetical protein